MIRFLLAFFRLSSKAVCEESQGLSAWTDFHDYPDSTVGMPWHMMEHQCRRCGKKFFI